MRPPTWKPEKVLHPALQRAGIVDGYTHVCRRKGCGHQEEHQDADLRHTYGSVLLMFGANLVSVQRLLGHSDPRITERRYSHFSPDFMGAEVNRLQFGLPALAPPMPASPATESERRGSGSASPEMGSLVPPLGTPVVQSARNHQRNGRNPSKKSSEVPAVEMARGTGFEPVAFGSGGRRSIQLS